jgi:hypothetical protein
MRFGVAQIGAVLNQNAYRLVIRPGSNAGTR